jgi:hypothetical protein
LTCAGIAHNLLRADQPPGPARPPRTRPTDPAPPPRLALARRVRGRLRRHPPRTTGPRGLTRHPEPTRTSRRPPRPPPAPIGPSRNGHTAEPSAARPPRPFSSPTKRNDHRPAKRSLGIAAVDRG